MLLSGHLGLLGQLPSGASLFSLVHSLTPSFIPTTLIPPHCHGPFRISQLPMHELTIYFSHREQDPPSSVGLVHFYGPYSGNTITRTPTPLPQHPRCATKFSYTDRIVCEPKTRFALPCQLILFVNHFLGKPMLSRYARSNIAITNTSVTCYSCFSSMGILFLADRKSVV